MTGLLATSCSQYENYSILTNNCHAFVSTFMNLIGYGGSDNW